MCLNTAKTPQYRTSWRKAKWLGIGEGHGVFYYSIWIKTREGMVAQYSGGGGTRYSGGRYSVFFLLYIPSISTVRKNLKEILEIANTRMNEPGVDSSRSWLNSVGTTI